MASITGEESILQRITSTWGEMFGSSALHTQTTALGEGIKSCTVGRGTIVTITTRDWQVMLQSISNKLLQWGVFYYKFDVPNVHAVMYDQNQVLVLATETKVQRFFYVSHFLEVVSFEKLQKYSYMAVNFILAALPAFMIKKTSSY